MENVVYNWIPSDWDELYYSIQSVKKYHKNLNKIYVLTENALPFNDRQVVPVYITDYGDTKERIIINNIKQFCSLKICDDFIYMCDDFFALKPFDSGDLMPPYYWQDLKGVAKYSETLCDWNRLLYNTLVTLEKFGHSTYNHATHTPSYIKCNQFLLMYDRLEGHHYQWESAYFNMWSESRRRLEEHSDYSICFHRPIKRGVINLTTRNITFISTTPQGLNDDMKEFIKEKYNKV